MELSCLIVRSNQNETPTNAKGTNIMTTKLPQGVGDIIYFAIGEASMCWSEVPTGIFNTTRANEIAKRLIAELALRDQAIARAAFEAARQWDNQKFNLYDLQTHQGYSFDSPDDYLQSEQFKKLVGGV